ncbi:DUF805 domain-containing protein [Curtobacterium aurantiacum]|uniref:DUF805 domain-containing protein n=1 Tax=Curtobacterium aurantiacum TaxID=3236919 RepID=A0ABS5VAS7_9MICO|nr:DUF805 domain-containing protein [Curtobacterium flaccumfaciens]MBT1543784.1 DUF805 domain-containing protein [Curtobacterium flaccumfaciens pv. flaccumfaciens]MBT1586571.1 DUF805 domain-containing protein [Curtobacterium flaccumfaciens pv. flaccumfaciens]
MSEQYPQHPTGQPNAQFGGAPQYGQQPPTGPNGEPPLWAPWYGISFGKAVGRFFKKYATFSGRASRSEFWWWYLANAIVGIVLGILYGIGFATSERSTVSMSSSTSASVQSTVTEPSALFVIVGIVSLLWGLAIIIPTLALGWRRLHDANLTGALWIIAIFVGIVGIVFGLLPSNPQGARFDRPQGSR